MASLFESVLINLGLKQKEFEVDVDDTPKIALSEDGSLIITSADQNSADINFDFISSNESELISAYRKISHIPEVANAIDEIINEMVVIEDGEDVIELNFDDELKNDAVKESIREAFDEAIELLDFNQNAYDIVKEWYVDSRIAFMVNKSKDSKSINSLTQLDPRRLKRVKLVDEETNGSVVVKEDYYVYLRQNRKHDDSFSSPNMNIQMSSNQYDTYREDVIYKIPKDLIIFTDSGLIDKSSNIIYGHLHKAIKTANLLELTEATQIIWLLNRSTQQRAIYVDTTGQTPTKSMTSLQTVRNAMSTKTKFDSSRGTVSNTSRIMSLRDDIFLTRNSGKATEITNVGPDGTFNELDKTMYFKEKLYMSLNVPISRFKDSTSIFANNSEINREELKLHRFITRIRTQFSKLILDLTKTILIIKGDMDREEWKDLSRYVKLRYNVDNHWTEIKNLEIMLNRINAVKEIDEYVGKYISHSTIRKNILMQSDEEIESEDKLMSDEADDPRYKNDEEF